MKYAVIGAWASTHAVARQCRVLGVSRSGYYAWRGRAQSAREAQDRRLLVHVRRVHLESRQRYGALKTWRELTRQGTVCGKHRIARLRRAHGIEALRRRRFKATTYARSGGWAAPDRVRRVFQAPAPDRLWVGDVTYLATRAGWLYLAMLMDLYSRRIVGWSLAERNDLALVRGALSMALVRRRPRPGLIHHTDRGRLYASGEYRQILDEHGVLPSMGRTGDCYDNAPAESFFSTLKNELVHGIHFQDRDHARREVVMYIEGFYNRRRLHQALGYLSPTAFEHRLAVPSLTRP